MTTAVDARDLGVPGPVAGWEDGLAALHRRSAGHFRRAEARARVGRSLLALLALLERENGWQLGEHLGETGSQGVQRLLNAAEWDGAAVRDPQAISPAQHPVILVAPTEEARAMLGSKAVHFFALLLPSEVWQLFGLEHPLGSGGFGGYIDIMPQQYGRTLLDEAIATVPSAMLEGFLLGTPGQIVARMRAFGESGLRTWCRSMCRALSPSRRHGTGSAETSGR